MAATPGVAYALPIDTTHLDAVDVAITLHGAPARFHLAMKVHAEYDAKYWRFIENVRVDRPIGGGTSDITRDDSTLWRVSLPGGNGTIRYRVRVQPPPPRLRDSWMPHARADGALINGPDFFLYVPELAHAPIMLGALHRWTFAEGSTQYTVAYWPQQQSVPFDTVAFVDGLERVARHAHAIFGRTPSTRYTMLIQDGATDALEHAASITAGVESDRLARSPHAWLSEIAHEYFHAWNLVAIRPTGFNDLSYRAPARTPLLWLSEGITRYYADARRRRAGLADSAQTRLERLRRLVERYLDSPGMRRVTRVRDATHDRRGRDDVMRRLFDQAQANGTRGITPEEVERSAAATCACAMQEFFDSQVRGTGPIDATPILRRLGLQLSADTADAVDGNGRALPDARVRRHQRRAISGFLGTAQDRASTARW